MRNKIFAYSVLALNVVAAWVSWWVLAGAIFGGMRHIWLYPILAFSFWGIVFTLSAIFVKNKRYIHAGFLASAVGYPVFFGLNLSLLGMLIAILMFVLTEIQVKREIARGLTINFYQLVSHTLKYFVTAICLVIAIAYYFSIAENSARPSATFLETKTLETEMDWGLKAASIFLPEDKKELANEITDNVTVDDFLSKNFVSPQIDEGAAAAKNIVPGGPTEATMLIGDATAVQIREEMLAKSKRDLSKQLGVNVIGERPMKEVLMSYIDKTERSFFEYSGSEKFYIPVILAFGLFLTARVLGTAVDIFLGLFILAIIKFLRAAGIIELSKEQKEAAVIEYSI
ncbi:MAG: hypothetical protein PHP25_03215 [Candidatus Moranbacteria bacterium]|nr:hypothetical protein [Candidatus Moranbacteria bacterium]